MTVLSQHSWTVKEETTYGTAVVPDRSMPLISDGIAPEFGIVSVGEEMYAGAIVETIDQSDPFPAGPGGSIEAFVPTKGFGLYLKHALGSGSIGSVTDSNYTQTHVLSATGKAGLSMTCQSNRPFTTGTDQKFTWEGMTILSLELSMEVEDFLRATIEYDGEDHTATGSATPTYPTYPSAGLAKFPWRLATITVDGAQLDMKSFKVKVGWSMDTARRRLRGSALKRQPLPSGKPTIEWSIEPDWASATYYNLLASATLAGRYKQIVATFNGPAALAGATVPQLVVTIPAARFDEGFPTVQGEEPLMQPISGVGLWDKTNPAITVTYRTTDAAI